MRVAALQNLCETLFPTHTQLKDCVIMMLHICSSVCRVAVKSLGEVKMQITVTTQEGGLYPLHVSDELLLSDLKVLLYAEVGVAVQEMLLIHNMRPLKRDDMMLKECGIQNEDILLLVNVNAGEGLERSPVSPPVHHQPQAQPDQLTQPGQLTQPAGGMQPALPNIDWGAVQVPG